MILKIILECFGDIFSDIIECFIELAHIGSFVHPLL